MSQQQQRITLTEPATRAMQMRQHVQSVAESILTDHRADGLFAEVLAARRHVHGYSVRNRILQSWQAPMARQVASLSAYEAMARDQGVAAVTVKDKPHRVLIRAGARGVWIWGRTTRRRQFHSSIGDDEQTEVSVSYIPVATWAVEDIVYAANGEGFVLPDHVIGVDDRALYDALVAFADHKGVQIVHRGIIGARGVSSGGQITLQSGDSPAVQLPVLAHEIAHELLHHVPGSERLSKTVVEGEAEAICAVLLRHYGHDVPASAAYLRGHGVRPADVLASMDRIIKATSEVIGFIEEQEENDDE